MIKINILFVAKDFIKSSLLIEMLKRQGYSVITSTRAKDSMAIMEDRKIDLLIVSQELADSNGLIFLKQIRNSQYKNMPVIAMVDFRRNDAIAAYGIAGMMNDHSQRAVALRSIRYCTVHGTRRRIDDRSR